MEKNRLPNTHHPYKSPFYDFNAWDEYSDEVSSQPDVVEIVLPHYGPIVGTRDFSLRENQYLSFKGIPYSKAGRFQVPVSVPLFVSVLSSLFFCSRIVLNLS
jgi:hypothetical protein